MSVCSGRGYKTDSTSCVCLHLHTPLNSFDILNSLLSSRGWYFLRQEEVYYRWCWCLQWKHLGAEVGTATLPELGSADMGWVGQSSDLPVWMKNSHGILESLGWPGITVCCGVLHLEPVRCQIFAYGFSHLVLWKRARVAVLTWLLALCMELRLGGGMSKAATISRLRRFPMEVFCRANWKFQLILAGLGPGLLKLLAWLRSGTKDRCPWDVFLAFSKGMCCLGLWGSLDVWRWTWSSCGIWRSLMSLNITSVPFFKPKIKIFSSFTVTFHCFHV